MLSALVPLAPTPGAGTVAPMEQPTPRPSGRIPRSATAPAQPTITWDLARTAAVCVAAADALDGVRVAATFNCSSERFRAADAAKAAAGELGRRSTGATAEVVCNSVSAAGLSYVRAVRTDVERAVSSDAAPRELSDLARRLGKLEAWICDGGLLLRLQRAWDEVALSALPNSDTVRAQLTASGMDAEALRWALIGFESHAHVRLVWQQAYRLAQTLPDRTAADLLGWGWQGLRVALDKFDPSKGFAFSTYACTRINGAIRDGNRAESPIPKRLTTYVRKVTRTQEALTYRLGRVPSLDELAEALGDEAPGLSMMSRLAPAASLDELTDPSSERAPLVRTLVDRVADPAEQTVAAAQARAISDALERLPLEERQAVELLVYQGLPVSEVKVLTGANPRQLRARKERGLAALSSHLADWAPVAS